MPGQWRHGDVLPGQLRAALGQRHQTALLAGVIGLPEKAQWPLTRDVHHTASRPENWDRLLEAVKAASQIDPEHGSHSSSGHLLDAWTSQQSAPFVDQIQHQEDDR